MRTNFASSAALALAASELIYAQTFSKCNPAKGDSCNPDPAFGNNAVTIDFTKGASTATDYFTFASGTNLDYDTSNGAVFTIKSASDAPTIVSKKYLFFGRVDCTIMAAPGQGIVTSFTLQSDDLDEIDWEWIGSDTTQAQSNYFGEGNTTTYDRGAYHPVSTPATTFHTYSVEWTSKSLQWIIDGTTVRTLNYADAVGGSQYPQTPMQVRLGTWVAGQASSAQGTIQWAGGLADFSAAPFKAYYKSCTIKDYGNGTEYSYTKGSGSFDSIKVLTGSSSTSTNGTSTSTSTSTSTKTSGSKATGTTMKTATATASSNLTANASGNSSTTSASSTSPTSTVSGATALSGMGALFAASWVVLAVSVL